jgi:hypothetical protein
MQSRSTIARFRQDFDNLVDGILGRPRGFARRELDRSSAACEFSKRDLLLAPAHCASRCSFTAWMQVFDFPCARHARRELQHVAGRALRRSAAESPVVLVAIDDRRRSACASTSARAAWRLDPCEADRPPGRARARTIAFDFYIEKPDRDGIGGSGARRSDSRSRARRRFR